MHLRSWNLQNKSVIMNKSESKYFNTAIKMDEAFIALLEKRILNILR